MAALIQKATQSAPKTAAQMARLIATNAKNEMVRVAETAQSQVLSTEIKSQNQTEKQAEQTPPAVVSQIKNEGVENVNREQLATWEQSRIKQLEDMISQVRRQDQQKLVQHNEMVQKEMHATTVVPTEAVGPVGKVRRAMGQAKQKVQTLLTSRKQSESKGGSGKG